MYIYIYVYTYEHIYIYIYIYNAQQRNRPNRATALKDEPNSGVERRLASSPSRLPSVKERLRVRISRQAHA